VLLDTCIAIDVLRGKPEAERFVTRLSSPPSFSVVSVMELEAGVREDREAQQMALLMSSWRLLDVDRPVAQRAGEWMRAFARSHGLAAIDALIAATADVHKLPLATLNLKHFPMFEGLERPY
jgi:predicted nucleic acid-binding protein